MVVTTLSQGCENLGFEIVTTLLQGCNNLVRRLWQGCSKVVDKVVTRL